MCSKRRDTHDVSHTMMTWPHFTFIYDLNMTDFCVLQALPSYEYLIKEVFS